MARLKSRPLHHTMKRKSQDKDRVHRENSRASSSKRPRLQSPNERQQTVTKKAQKKRANVSHKTLEDAHLPPELRKAGLMAHIAISKGKCFGPFKGRITNNRKPPGKMHFLVSQMADRKGKLCFFYACKNEKDKCSWLSRLQSAVSEEAQNIVAYKNSSGVYFEAVKDIAEGEELLVLFDESFKESGNTSDRESTPTVSYITDESGGKIAVVPLGREVDASKVFVHPVEDDDKNGVDGVDIDNDDDNDDDGNDNDDDDNDGNDNDNDGNDNDDNDNDDIDNDDDEDIDYGEEDGVSKETDESFDEQDYATEDSSDENDDSDEVIGSDDDFVPENQSKPIRKTVKRKRISEEGVVKMKKENEKQQPSIKELPVADSENDTNSVKYCCSHCLEEFPEKGEALAHTAAMECLAKEFQCSTCRLEFTDASLLQNHLCGGKPRCKICDEEFEERAQLQAHKKTPPTDHRPRCAKCDVQFESSREKNQHARTKHGSTEKQAECPICQKTYNKSYLKDHMITHSQSETLKCQECEKTFSSKSNLNKHRKKHVPGYTPNSSKQREKKFTCPEEGCEKTFDSRHALKSHQRCHTGERPFQCEQCSWRFTQKTHLTRHIKGVHEKIPRSKQSNGRSLAPVTCDLCNKVYVNSRVLAVHKQSVHNRLRPYKCDYCDATYTQRGHLWRHKHASHFEKEEVQKKYTTNKFCCNFDGCDQLFDTESELKEHVTSHVGTTDKVCMCDECGATFAAQQNLFKHKKRRHSGPMPQPHKTHRCEKCDKSFFTSYQLVVHFRCHTGEKPYKCDLCGKDFVQKSGLRKHIRCKRCPMIEGGPINNKNSKKYACEQCDKMFPGPSDLKAHQRTHTGERPYVCETCGKGFSQPGNLTKHVRFVHKKEQRPKEKVREKKYFCSLCGKAFLCPSSLAMHCRTHSGDKPFSCEICGQAFAQAGNLKKHTKRWHENGGGRAPRRRKAKDQNVFMETMESQKEIEPHEEHLSNQTPVAVQQGDSNVVISEADVTDLGSVPAQGFQDRQTTCTPLNTPSHLYAATPLNTAVPSSSQNPASQRIPVLFGFIAPLDPNTMSSAQVSESPVRIPTEQNGHANRANEGVAINAPSTPPQTTTTSLASMSAQELQQVVISRMLASENAEAAFLPPNLAGFATNSPPRAQVLLPHMHSLIASTGGNSVGEVTVWPFSANGGGFQQ